MKCTHCFDWLSKVSKKHDYHHYIHPIRSLVAIDNMQLMNISLYRNTLTWLLKISTSYNHPKGFFQMLLRKQCGRGKTRQNSWYKYEYSIKVCFYDLRVCSIQFNYILMQQKGTKAVFFLPSHTHNNIIISLKQHSTLLCTFFHKAKESGFTLPNISYVSSRPTEQPLDYICKVHDNVWKSN